MTQLICQTKSAVESQVTQLVTKARKLEKEPEQLYILDCEISRCKQQEQHLVSIDPWRLRTR